MNEERQGQIDIELTEDIAEGTYANLAIINHSDSEFILDFIKLMPGTPKARVKSRIILTPQHAKRLLKALSDNIGHYEREHAEISEGEYPIAPFHFGGPAGEA